MLILSPGTSALGFDHSRVPGPVWGVARGLSLILDARYYLILLMPNLRAGGKTAPQIYKTQAYNETRGQLDAIYASTRLKLPFEGLLLVGY